MPGNAKLRVGLIGANVKRGWGMAAHIPALKNLPGFELAAVAASRAENAAEAARHFGVAQSFGDYREMVRRSDLDVIAVTVKVPAHCDMVMAALEAGKHVYCEWPLGKDAAEAERMAQAAKKKGVRCIVGLQARGLPGIHYVRDLVAGGHIGRVLGVTMLATSAGWGAATDAASAYLFERANGASLLTIPGGHSLDAMCHCVGDFKEVSATLAVLRDHTTIAATGQRMPADTAEQIAVTGVLRDGGVVSFHCRGGTKYGAPFLLEIHGEGGDLVVSGDATVQYADLAVSGSQAGAALANMSVPASYRHVPDGVPSGRPYNVAHMYVELEKAIREGRAPTPSFDEAVTRHRLLEAIQKASDTGARQQVG